MRLVRLALKAILWALGVSLLGYILLVCYLFFGPRIKSYSNKIPFESSQWKAHLNDRDLAKQKMVDDLMSRHKLVGMSVNEVEELLGKPPTTGYFKDYDYVYWLGPERSVLGVDSEWLGIKFQDGVVIKADILRD